MYNSLDALTLVTRIGARILFLREGLAVNVQTVSLSLELNETTACFSLKTTSEAKSTSDPCSINRNLSFSRYSACPEATTCPEIETSPTAIPTASGISERMKNLLPRRPRICAAVIKVFKMRSNQKSPMIKDGKEYAALGATTGVSIFLTPRWRHAHDMVKEAAPA